MAAEVRVRYAPSPTGQPHIGNIRTALFNWLYARHHGGKFIVRIEDTDQTRFVEGAIDAILDGLRWLNIDWDEGPEVQGPHAPYEQSNRLEIYQRLSEQLLDQANAYYCYCSREGLEQLRRSNRESGSYSGDGCRCRQMGKAGAVGDPSATMRGSFDSPCRRAASLKSTTSFVAMLSGEMSFRRTLSS